jgi:hypothetical protein
VAFQQAPKQRYQMKIQIGEVEAIDWTNPKTGQSVPWRKMSVTDLATNQQGEMSCWDKAMYNMLVPGVSYDIDYEVDNQGRLKMVAIRPLDGGQPAGQYPAQPSTQQMNQMGMPGFGAPAQAPAQGPGLAPQTNPAPATVAPLAAQGDGAKRGNALNVASQAFMALVGGGYLVPPDDTLKAGEVAVIGWTNLQLRRLCRGAYTIDATGDDPDKQYVEEVEAIDASGFPIEFGSEA